MGERTEKEKIKAEIGDMSKIELLRLINEFEEYDADISIYTFYTDAFCL